MRRAIIIGLDGMSWNVLAELFSRGVMSNLNTFRKKGVYGELKSIIPPFTVPTWTSLSTGVNPGKHGACSFLMTKKDYSSRIVESKDVKYPRIYEVLSMRGLSSVVINLPLSYPPVTFKGILISDWLYPRLKVFPSKAKDIAEDYAPLDPLWQKREASEYIENMLGNLKSRLNVIERLLSKETWTLFFVVFSEPDFLLHKIYFDVMSGKGLAKEAYKIFDTIDNFIGTVAQNMPSDSLLMLVSDHGFTAYRYVAHVNKILKDAGLIYLKTIKREDRSRENLHAQKRKIYIPKFIYSKVAEVEAVRKVANLLFNTLFSTETIPFYKTSLDFASSHVFMHFSGHFGIYINLKDFFPGGMFSNEEANRIENFVKNLLVKMKNPYSGENVFKRVEVRERFFHGPYVKEFPHIICVPKNDCWIDARAVGKAVEKKSLAYHSLTGIFAALGDNVKQRVKLNQTSILDIAPTILHFLGLPIPHDSDGKVLLDMFKEESEIKKRLVKKANYLEQWNIIRKGKLLLRKQ